MTGYEVDELFLRGRVQVETALGALAHTGINPEAQQRLQTLLDIHTRFSDGDSQNDLSIYLRGAAAEQEKSDIISSLQVVKDDVDATRETRLAAVALYEYMHPEQTGFSRIEFSTGGDIPAAALDIRRKVFIEGQDVPVERERDGLDSQADHYIGYKADEPIATARVRNIEGIAKIERVAVLSEHRGGRYGMQLMQHIICHLQSQGFQEVILEAQTYVQSFYEKLGFTATGNVFEDANIPHIKMVRSLAEPPTQGQPQD